MGFVFIPFYVSYLGISGYGIIGFFALLQLWLGVFEVSLSAGLNRKMASFLKMRGNFQGFGISLELLKFLLFSLVL